MPFAELDDVRLHYTIDGDPGSDKPVLMLSNSLGTSGEMWNPQLAQFTPHFRVLRYDTRGHGKSEVTPGPYSIPKLGKDVLGLLDHLAFEKVHFCGLSMGGITGMWLALNAPERIDHLILSNTAAFIGPSDAWTTRADKVLKEGLGSIAAGVISRWLTPEYAEVHPEKVAALTTLLKTTPDEGYAANCIAVRDADFRGDISRIGAPTLVISGTGDVPTPPSDGRFLADNIANARYIEFDGAHLANQQAEGAYGDAVRAFLGVARH